MANDIENTVDDCGRWMHMVQFNHEGNKISLYLEDIQCNHGMFETPLKYSRSPTSPALQQTTLQSN